MRYLVNLIRYTPSYSTGLLNKAPCINGRVFKKIGEVKFCSTTKNEEKIFIPIYHWPAAPYACMLSKQKSVIGLATCASSAALSLGEVMGYIPQNTTIVLAIIGFTLTSLLSCVGLFLKNTIGIIYVSKDMNTIKLSTIDFWGKRNEVFVPAKDWVFLSDVPRPFLSKFYVNTSTYSNDNSWKLVHRGGVILEKDIFDRVLGIL